MAAPKEVFILLFNANTESEGVHSLKIQGRDVVLMFESEDDATRYALLLEAQDFPTPTVEAINQDEIDVEQFDYDWLLVPANFVPEGELDRLLLVPPETNVDETDWQPDQEKAAASEMADLEAFRRHLEGLL